MLQGVQCHSKLRNVCRNVDLSAIKLNPGGDMNIFAYLFRRHGKRTEDRVQPVTDTAARQCNTLTGVPCLHDLRGQIRPGHLETVHEALQHVEWHQQLKICLQTFNRKQ